MAAVTAVHAVTAATRPSRLPRRRPLRGARSPHYRCLLSATEGRDSEPKRPKAGWPRCRAGGPRWEGARVATWRQPVVGSIVNLSDRHTRHPPRARPTPNAPRPSRAPPAPTYPIVAPPPRARPRLAVGQYVALRWQFPPPVSAVRKTEGGAVARSSPPPPRRPGERVTRRRRGDAGDLVSMASASSPQWRWRGPGSGPDEAGLLT